MSQRHVLFALVLLGALGASSLVDAANPQPAQLLKRAKTQYESDEFQQVLITAQQALDLTTGESDEAALQRVAAHELLGDTYDELGAYAQSEEHYRAALSIRKQVQGDSHPDVAAEMGNLALIKATIGRPDEAKHLYQQILPILEADKNHQAELASVLTNMAIMHKSLGEFEKGLAFHQRSLAIRKSLPEYGPEHPETAVVLDNIAVLFLSWHKPQEAKPFLVEAHRILEKRLGANHVQTIKVVHNMSRYYSEIGDFDKSLQLELQALTAFEQKFGSQHPEVANCLNSMGKMYLRKGDLANAEAKLLAALHMRESLFGPDNPVTMLALNDLALVRMAMNRPTSAMELLRRSLAFSEEMLGKIRRVTVDRAIADYLSTLRDEAQEIYSLAEASSDSAAARLGLIAAVLRKGRSLDVAAESAKSFVDNFDPAAQEKFRQLSSKRQLLSAMLLRRSGGLTDAQYQQRATKLEREIDELVQELSALSPRFKGAQQVIHVETILDEVAAKLPADSALVEIVQFTPFLFNARRNDAQRGAPRYSAMVLLPDQARTVRVVSLGEASSLDHEIRKFLAEISRSPVMEAGCQRQSNSSRVRAAAVALYQRLLAPLSSSLAGRRKLFLSLDGDTQLVPFSALHDESDYLLGRYRFNYLNSTRDLLRPSESKESRSSVLVFADPDLDHPPTHFALAQERPRNNQQQSTLATPPVRRGSCINSLPRLKGTREEAQIVKALFPMAQLLLGTAASETSLLSVDAPEILHIAGHGLYFDDDEACTTANPAQRGVRISEGDATLHASLKSGIVLAGARVDRGQGDVTYTDDGITTALEFSSINLRGTQLVVLATCGSGRGTVVPGEGVFGLRRAVMIAGAETLVSSLWTLEDSATRELMKLYYEQLHGGADRVEAMDTAAQTLRATLDEPYYWASTVVIGQAGKLRGFPVVSPPLHRPESAVKGRIALLLAPLALCLIILLLRRTRRGT